MGQKLVNLVVVRSMLRFRLLKLLMIMLVNVSSHAEPPG